MKNRGKRYYLHDESLLGRCGCLFYFYFYFYYIRKNYCREREKKMLSLAMVDFVPLKDIEM